jgi:hypothetical protein
MRLYQKAILIYGTGALAAIMISSFFMGRCGYGMFLALLPVFVTARMADRQLICPHCQKRATVLQGGMRTPWVGSKCRSCGKEY